VTAALAVARFLAAQAVERDGEAHGVGWEGTELEERVTPFLGSVGLCGVLERLETTSGGLRRGAQGVAPDTGDPLR